MLNIFFYSQGCDASILLDSTNGGTPEIISSKNFGVRKLEHINYIKSMVEAACPLKVSCADILVLAAREAVALSLGPRIPVPLGRRDSAVAPSSKAADTLLPPVSINVDGMLQLFAGKGMTVEEAVAIMGTFVLHLLFFSEVAFGSLYPCITLNHHCGLHVIFTKEFQIYSLQRNSSKTE